MLLATNLDPHSCNSSYDLLLLLVALTVLIAMPKIATLNLNRSYWHWRNYIVLLDDTVSNDNTH